jgi:hypothetical protein
MGLALLSRFVENKEDFWILGRSYRICILLRLTSPFGAASRI